MNEPWRQDPLYGGMSDDARRKSWNAAQPSRSGVNELTGVTPVTGGPHGPGAPKIQSASDLKDREFPPISYVVPRYLAEGCTILAGKPKLGKSWLMLHAAIAVARGTSTLGSSPCPEGDVLYLALEDNERRLQDRITKLIGFSNDWPVRLNYATEWPRADAGGLDAIRRWISEVERPRLIIVDVLTRFRPARSNKDAPYESDYQAIAGLQSIASEFHLAIVIVHHLRKAGSDVDKFDLISGTLGLSGAADACLILDRDANGTTLYGRGRDVPEIETAVQFSKERFIWTVVGPAADVHRSQERRDILQVLRKASEPLSPREVSDLIDGASYGAIRKTLSRMAAAGEIEKQSRGRYACPNGPNGTSEDINPS